MFAGLWPRAQCPTKSQMSHSLIKILNSEQYGLIAQNQNLVQGCIHVISVDILLKY